MFLKEIKNDDDMFSDEAIDKRTVDIQTLLHTHVGSTRDNDEDDMDDQTTYALSVQAMQQASRMWPEEKSRPDATMKEIQPNANIRNTAKQNLRN